MAPIRLFRKWANEGEGEGNLCCSNILWPLFARVLNTKKTLSRPKKKKLTDSQSKEEEKLGFDFSGGNCLQKNVFVAIGITWQSVLLIWRSALLLFFCWGIVLLVPQSTNNNPTLNNATRSSSKRGVASDPQTNRRAIGIDLCWGKERDRTWETHGRNCSLDPLFEFRKATHRRPRQLLRPHGYQLLPSVIFNSNSSNSTGKGQKPTCPLAGRNSIRCRLPRHRQHWSFRKFVN